MVHTSTGSAPQREPNLHQAVAAFFYTLSQQAQMGTPIAEAITALSAVEQNVQLRVALLDIAAKLNAPRPPHYILGDLTGPTLNEAFDAHPKVFEPAVRLAMTSGEFEVDVALGHTYAILAFSPPIDGASKNAPEGRAFFHTLGRLLEAGAPVIQSIRVAGKREEAEMPIVAQAMIDVIERGGSAIRALKGFPEIFDAETVARLEVAEDAGTLGRALIEAAQS
jgi:type II secretory pathway component PulF